ncbi:MAG: alpha/beta fold hydrolase [Burkholderiaceae bacterium]|nr:alpha/beta fold hydrolase [Burkholderiaceae bacterium]
MPVLTSDYKAPRWVAGAHLQTIIPAKVSKRPHVDYRRERWETPDGDFVDVDWAHRDGLADETPVVLHIHGLEGSSRSHYALALMDAVVRRGWRGIVSNFRTCSGEPNRTQRAYHAGDTAEVAWLVEQVNRRFPKAPLYLVGVSLGGNQVALYLGQQGEAAARYVTKAVSVGAPVDLVAGSDLMCHGVNRLYAKNFLQTLIPKALQKLEQFPEMRRYYTPKQMKACRHLADFDALFTGPVHGYKDSMDYWTRCSSKPHLKNVRVPLLLLNAKNDPFLPAWALPTVDDVSEFVWLEQPDEGGHIGFPLGAPPGRLDYLPNRILRFLEEGY